MRHALACAGVVLAFGAHAEAGWVLQQSGTTQDLYGVAAHHGQFHNIAWVCGAGGTILHTTDGGMTWDGQESGTTRTLRAMAFKEDGGGAVIAVGDSSTLLVTTDSGAHWSARATGTTANLRGVSEFRFYAVGDSGVVLRSTDVGVTWSKVESGTTARLNAVSGVFTATIVGDAGTILRGTGDGVTWTPVASGRSEDLLGVPMFSSLNLVVGAAGLILQSTNNGQSWTAAATGTVAPLMGAQFSVGGATRAYCVGAGGTILKTMGSGIWGRQASGTDADLHAVMFYLNDSVGWVVGDGGTILKTTDAGGVIVDVLATGGAETAARFEPPGCNPCHGTVPLAFRLAATADVRLRIVDVRGRERATVAQRRFDPGPHRLVWQAGNIENGVYFAVLEAGDAAASQRLVLAR